jgi:glutaconyl-CoA/methylmalonyl-CoA decarboxylase subunit gamma
MADRYARLPTQNKSTRINKMKIKVKVGNQSYLVEVLDLQARPVIAMIDGEKFEVWPDSKLESIPLVTPVVIPDTPVQAVPVVKPVPAPDPGPAPQTNQTVVAPIPGIIVTISVKVGDLITAGQELCLLEAMKMKNSIKASHSGQVTAVPIALGSPVKKGQTLVEFKS